jgi:late competence protein required for DNA uptake (superfamily II DNA/RNA helicase)
MNCRSTRRRANARRAQNHSRKGGEMNICDVCKRRRKFLAEFMSKLWCEECLMMIRASALDALRKIRGKRRGADKVGGDYRAALMALTGNQNN